MIRSPRKTAQVSISLQFQRLAACLAVKRDGVTDPQHPRINGVERRRIVSRAVLRQHTTQRAVMTVGLADPLAFPAPGQSVVGASVEIVRPPVTIKFRRVAENSRQDVRNGAYHSHALTLPMFPQYSRSRKILAEYLTGVLLQMRFDLGQEDCAEFLQLFFSHTVDAGHLLVVGRVMARHLTQ
jgi:hypothetical protein